MAERSFAKHLSLLQFLGITDGEMPDVLAQKIGHMDIAVIIDNSLSMLEVEPCMLSNNMVVDRSRLDQAALFYNTMVSVFEAANIRYTTYTMLEKVNTFIQTPFTNDVGYVNSGGTPTITTIVRALSEGTKDILLIIITDGQPTDCEQWAFIPKIKELQRNYKRGKVYMSFVACTENQSDIEFMNKLDKKVRNVDVSDDYQSEFNEILRVTGKPISYNKYITKAIIGSVVPELDTLDEDTKCRCTIA